MILRIRTLLPLLLIAVALAALGYWNIRPETFLETPKSSSTNAKTIDFYAENVYAIQFQEDGKRDYEMRSDHLEHVQSSDVTYMTNPRMELYRGADIPWNIRSKRGEVGPKGEEVELIDSVRVERTDANARPSILTTSRLTLFPGREYAQTEQAVRIDAANGVTTGQGMKAYLNEGRMILQSNVRGQHEAR
jgi:lipopolysaccharide export system protein LptC